ncbi:MAG TPA: LytTR family DNA-binding domain-containing protein [Candidatus Saccharimonadales bacterium]|nr:LytTR family DNA-binding domain-containing protein [Candidatus Saccharimonadales bacterium]
MESKLDPGRFLRVHRRHIVDISRIVAIHPLLSGSYQIQMKTGAQIATGRQYKTAVQNLLKT